MDFALIMFSMLVLTGGIWLLDRFVLSDRRKVKSAAIGIKVRMAQGFLDRRDREWRWAERILVRRELDDVRCGKSEFARDFFDRSARQIDGQLRQRLVQSQVHNAFRIFSTSTCLAMRSRMS